MDADSDVEDNEPCLSAATLEALKLFALSSGIAVNPETADVVSAVRSHFDIHEREQVFHIMYGEGTEREIKFDVFGVKRTLGQTLSSTGLTIWRAAEHLCQWIFDHPDRFNGKIVCELGAGLGMVSILLDKLHVCRQLVSTDGDDDTVDLLLRNVNSCDSKDIAVSKLYWGDHDVFVATYPDKFDILCAADIIYEREQIEPLISTVTQIMKPNGEFILAFARRNVPMDAVIAQAASVGLKWEVIDEDIATSEHIYRFFW